MNRWLRVVPLALTGLRALLAPVVLLLAWYNPSRWLLGAALVAAFLSDVFDGIIARRLGIATAALRRLDSAADTIYYLAVAIAAWHLHPAAIREHFIALGVLGALEVSRYVLDLAKFGREASYHMWSSKCWGVCLFGGLVALLVSDGGGAAVALAIYPGIVADLEGIGISLVLPAWTHDVPSIVHAVRLREVARRAP